MAYATITDVFARYKPIGSMVGAGSLDVSSNDVSSVFVAQAEAFMDSFLAARYITPVTTDKMITMIASDFAVAYMMFEKLPGRTPDFIQARYDRSLSYLEMLRDGKMLLTASNVLVTSGDSEAWSSTGSYHSTFSPVLDAEDQAVDQTYVTAENDTRADDLP